ARSGVGASLSGVAGIEGLFGESPSRVIVCCETGVASGLRTRAEALGVPVRPLGVAGGDRLMITAASDEPLIDLAMADVVARYEGALPSAFGIAATH
ncbi:MAG TPA: hypothetical protein VF855_14500, partial [Acidimicrobiales bacterium]